MKLTDEEKRNLIYLRKFYSLKEISALTGLSIKTIVQNTPKREKGGLPWIAERNKQILSDYKNGFTNIKYLAEKHFCSVSTIKNALGKEFVHQKPKIIDSKSEKTQGIIKALEEAKTTGETLASIAERFNCTRQNVSLIKIRLEKEKDGE